MKKHFNKELVITEKDNEDFENSTKCCICDDFYVDGDIKARYNFHVTGKYFEKFQYEFLNKEMFCSLLTGKPFDSKTYKKTEAVAMGSSFGSTLAKDFLCHYEKIWPP